MSGLLIDFNNVSRAFLGPLQEIGEIYIGGNLAWTSRIPPDPLTGTITAGAGDGEVTIDVTALPTFWGQAPGGELGVLGTIEYKSPWTNQWTEIADPAAVATYTVWEIELLWGRLNTFKIRPVSAQGWAGPELSVDITLAGAQYDAEPVLQFDEEVTQDGVPVVIAVPTT